MKFIAFLLSPQFRKHLLILIALVIVLFFSLTYWLQIFTRHGESYTLPNLIGQTLSEAQDNVSAADIKLDADTVYIEGKTPGTIVQQDPDGDTQVKLGRSVYVSVQASELPKIALPDLTGRSLTEVTAILNSYGLKVGAQIYKPDIALNVVLGAEYKGHSLKAGQLVSRGDAIDLILGDGFGESKIPTPNLTGLTLDEVIFTLRGNALLLGKVHKNSDLPSDEAVVYKQIPSPIEQDSIETGSQITIFLR